MWINVFDKPVPVRGADGRVFVLSLRFHKRYGYNLKKDEEIVFAIWDSTQEAFYEKETMTEINSEDIVCWWE